MNNQSKISLGPIVVMCIVVFLVTLGTMYLWEEYQNWKMPMSPAGVPGMVPVETQPSLFSIPPAFSTLDAKVQELQPTIDSMATHSAQVTEAAIQAQAQIDKYNAEHAAPKAPVNNPSLVMNTPGPALVAYSTCRDTRIYSTTNDGDEFYIGFLPKDTVAYILAQSSDGQWIQFFANGAATEWWTPITNICSQ